METKDLINLIGETDSLLIECKEKLDSNHKERILEQRSKILDKVLKDSSGMMSFNIEAAKITPGKTGIESITEPGDKQGPTPVAPDVVFLVGAPVKVFKALTPEHDFYFDGNEKYVGQIGKVDYETPEEIDPSIKFDDSTTWVFPRTHITMEF